MAKGFLDAFPRNFVSVRMSTVLGLQRAGRSASDVNLVLLFGVGADVLRVVVLAVLPHGEDGRGEPAGDG